MHFSHVATYSDKNQPLSNLRAKSQASTILCQEIKKKLVSENKRSTCAFLFPIWLPFRVISHLEFTLFSRMDFLNYEIFQFFCCYNMSDRIWKFLFKWDKNVKYTTLRSSSYCGKGKRGPLCNTELVMLRSKSVATSWNTSFKHTGLEPTRKTSLNIPIIKLPDRFQENNTDL